MTVITTELPNHSADRPGVEHAREVGQRELPGDDADGRVEVCWPENAVVSMIHSGKAITTAVTAASTIRTHQPDLRARDDGSGGRGAPVGVDAGGRQGCGVR